MKACFPASSSAFRPIASLLRSPHDSHTISHRKRSLCKVRVSCKERHAERGVASKKGVGGPGHREGIAQVSLEEDPRFQRSTP